MDYEMEDRMEDLIENRMNNERPIIMGDPNQILESMSVIDKQNLVTTYVMVCYNLLYSTSAVIARHLVTPRFIDLLTRNVLERNMKPLRVIADDPRLPPRYSNSFTFNVCGPSDWELCLFEDPLEMTLTMSVTATDVKISHKLKSSSTPINDDVEEAQNVIIDEARERRAQERGRCIPIHTDNADVLVTDDDSHSSGTFDLQHLPTKCYTVYSETFNRFTRENDFKSISADSTISFGVKLHTDPESDPEDTSCEMSIFVSTIAHYYDGYCLLCSMTQVKATKIHGNVTEQIDETSKPVYFEQPMNRKFAELILDGIANNYTAVVQIIGLALILHFSE